MSWRIATRHTSTYRYSDPVVASYNEARITPATGAGQRVIESSLQVTPATPLFSYRDYWTTTVIAFDVAEPHTELVVTGASIVETSSFDTGDRSMSWDELARHELRDLLSEFLLETPYTSSDAELDHIAAGFRDAATPRDAVDATCAWIRNALTYELGATAVSTSALEAWRAERGVCQDFAHLTLVLLRALGIPARYVSGYLHPRSEAEIGDRVAGASHAWVECWLNGWYAVDPTNGELVGDRHVTVARGRDYADVAPFRGVYHGGALRSLDVTVELTRLA